MTITNSRYSIYTCGKQTTLATYCAAAQTHRSEAAAMRPRGSGWWGGACPRAAQRRRNSPFRYCNMYVPQSTGNIASAAVQLSAHRTGRAHRGCTGKRAAAKAPGLTAGTHEYTNVGYHSGSVCTRIFCFVFMFCATSYFLRGGTQQKRYTPVLALCTLHLRNHY